MEITKHYTSHKLLGYTPKRQDRKYAPKPFTVFISGIPSVKDILTALREKWELEIEIGVSELHPDDEFVRKIGSEMARKNAKPEVIKVAKIEFIYHDCTIVSFVGPNHSFSVFYNTTNNKLKMHLHYKKGDQQ